MSGLIGGGISIDADSALGLLGMYIDAVVVEVKKNLLLGTYSDWQQKTNKITNVLTAKTINWIGNKLKEIEKNIH